MEKSNWQVWAFRWVLLTCLSVAAWLGQQVWTGQQRMVERLNAIEVDRTSRFTTIEWRITALEAGTVRFEKSLDRIENKLGTK